MGRHTCLDRNHPSCHKSLRRIYHHSVLQGERRIYHHPTLQGERRIYHHPMLQGGRRIYHHPALQGERQIYHHPELQVERQIYRHPMLQGERRIYHHPALQRECRICLREQVCQAGQYGSASLLVVLGIYPAVHRQACLVVQHQSDPAVRLRIGLAARQTGLRRRHIRLPALHETDLVDRLRSHLVGAPAYRSFPGGNDLDQDR
jgi:hypothetical protein